MRYFDPIDVLEKTVLTFDFTKTLGTAEVLTSPVVIVTLLRGVDATPASVVQGTGPTLDVTGKKILVPVQGRINGCDYAIKAQATVVGNAAKVPTMTGVLPVREGA
jgi:hypothetical protein